MIHDHSEEDEDEDDGDDCEDGNCANDEILSTETTMTSKSDYDFVKNPSVIVPETVQILEILPSQCLRIILKQNIEKLTKLIQKQSTYDNTCKITPDTDYVLVEKAGNFVVGVKIAGSSGHTDFRAINVKVFGSAEEYTVSKSKAGIHKPEQ